jgi:type I restriction enzyme S subunit
MDRKSTTNLGSVIEINPASISKHYPYDEIEYVDISSVDTGSFSGSTRMPLDEAPSRAKRLVEHGDTILATVRPNLRSFLFIKNPSENMVVSTGFAVLHPSNKIDARFLYYTVTDQKFTDYLTANAKGSAYPAVDTETIARAEISFPTLEIQQKIAAILSAYDDLIENNLRRIKILEEMAQSLYREWFVKFRFPGHQKVKMIDSPLGKIPEGWAVRKLGDIVAEIIDYRGRTPKKLGGEWSESGILALSAKNIKGGQLINLDKANWVSPQLFTKWMKCELQIQDILMTSEAPLGELYYLAHDKKYCLSQRLFAIRADPRIIRPSVLYYELLSPGIQAQIHERATGTTVLGIRQALLREVPIIVPPRYLQGVVGNQLDNLIELKANLSEKNTNLRATLDLLLPKLISGELDVSELDITIPEAKA